MQTGKIEDSRLNTFYTQNPDFDILSFNLSAPTELSRLNWQNLDQATILNLLKQYQRLLRLHPDPNVAMTLLGASQAQDVQPERLQLAAKESTSTGEPASQEAASSEALPKGLDSAQAIASLPREQFVQRFGAAVGGEAVAEQIHQDATTITAKTMLLWANVHNLVASPYFRAAQVNNTGNDIYQFENLPDYQELFGSLDFCTCDECSSIFGPAAYFVDLLRITDQYITTPNAIH